MFGGNGFDQWLLEMVFDVTQSFWDVMSHGVIVDQPLEFQAVSLDDFEVWAVEQIGSVDGFSLFSEACPPLFSDILWDWEDHFTIEGSSDLFGLTFVIGEFGVVETDVDFIIEKASPLLSCVCN